MPFISVCYQGIEPFLAPALLSHPSVLLPFTPTCKRLRSFFGSGGESIAASSLSLSSAPPCTTGVSRFSVFRRME